MRMLTRLADVVFWLGLILWVSALVTAGVSAAMSFPTMREFEVLVPRFSAYDESQHWAIAAGVLMERIFTFTDMVQLVAAALVLVGLAVGYSPGGRRFRQRMEMLRIVCVLSASLLLTYRVVLLAPQMNASLQRYWHAAEHGHAELAAKHRTEFQDKHPVASRIYGIMLVLLLGAAAGTAWTPLALPPPTARPGEPVEPDLVRKARR
jgi:hypothetical protein